MTASLTCRCAAYAFPHAVGRGRCSGSDWLRSHVNDTCAGCIYHYKDSKLRSACELTHCRDPIANCRLYADELRKSREELLAKRKG